ncbi:hypothetical protein [Roseateles asaccharophilus]|uniref:Uncharacterized protein n=1 Tax=Roseateles asaccharophilus TaxID=582607 RepID=A0ABU2A249_9BURK|nr:hypothetical protein [Roseateles asaccharophilus]MDR7331268.1 hypothetical protein [Roseateles asaccharophilus]
MNKPPTPLPPPVPGAHPDDDSVAGEEDPGAALEEMPPSAPPRPLPPRPPATPAGS